MIYFIKYLIRVKLKGKGIYLVFAYMLLLLISSLLITLVEPADSALTHFDQALWWSVVTSTTVGYGDMFPVSNPGRIVAVILPMFMGIGLGAAFITHFASSLIERRDKKMHGEKRYKGTDHILIVGCTTETEQLVEEIRKDETYADQDIVLLDDIPRHPFPDMDRVCFVKGSPDTLNKLNKANVKQAARIIIHTGNDEKNLFALINALELKHQACEITVRCISTQSLDTFSSVQGDFQIIVQMTAEMMVQAMQDKVHIPLQILLKNDAQEEIYYVLVSKTIPNLTWWVLHDYLKDKYNYLTFAMQTTDNRVMVNPSKEETISKGDGIWLMAQKRPLHITWPS
ncbi:ion channel [Desulfobacula phenolica]|uniref:Voltage-gated potassium channel n=1 Tax=Desulfobacula phenolica TaxID=90732 RepID=A0A1H2J943_9BACT|nr:ion channel [Desulfobacula phenolica]SDU52940.1 voltage-gated potassium channel [Desulfobacula phenolica]